MHGAACDLGGHVHEAEGWRNEGAVHRFVLIALGRARTSPSAKAVQVKSLQGGKWMAVSRGWPKRMSGELRHWPAKT